MIHTILFRSSTQLAKVTDVFSALLLLVTHWQCIRCAGVRNRVGTVLRDVSTMMVAPEGCGKAAMEALRRRRPSKYVLFMTM